MLKHLAGRCEACVGRHFILRCRFAAGSAFKGSRIVAVIGRNVIEAVEDLQIMAVLRRTRCDAVSREWKGWQVVDRLVEEFRLRCRVIICGQASEGSQFVGEGEAMCCRFCQAISSRVIS